MKRYGTLSNITSIELFDCNCCYGRSARPAFRYAPDVQTLEEEMDFCGISRALVFNAGQRFENPMERNSELSADIKHRSRLCPSWAALPLSGGEMPSPELFFAQMMENGIKALRFFPQEHHFSLDSSSFSGLFELAAAHGTLVFAKENILRMKDLLGDFPDVNIVAVNQGPHSIERYLGPMLEKHRNLFLDTSYLMTDGMLEDFCERHGPERLLFGSAFPDNCAGGAVTYLMRADISENARKRIASGNLNRLLGGVNL